MSKVIVEMEMPCKIQFLAGLRGTPTCPIERRICRDSKNPPSWCPIKGVLPDEHGDLIDRDKAIFEMCEGLAPKGYRAWAKRYLKSEKINPTVIAAERKNE